MTRFARGMAVAACLALVPAIPARAQDASVPARTVQATAPYPPEQLEQMLAPIALYPDPLLAQVLMAATYPLEVVQEDRWLQQPDNAGLTGEALAAALQDKPWDVNVKALASFPQTLRMMDDNLTWTEQLGDAFLADEGAVMDAVQRLRQRAQAAGQLQTTPREIVSYDGAAIAVEPQSSDVVPVPVYDPTVVYGAWPYPDYPPYYFPGYYGAVYSGGLGLAWIDVPIVVPWWGWGRWDWRGRHVIVDPGRMRGGGDYAPPTLAGRWRHDPIHRGGVPYRDPQTRGRLLGDDDRRPDLRGFPPRGQLPPVSRHVPPPISRAAPAPVDRSAPVFRQPAPGYRQLAPPATYESFGRGADVRAQADRGRASRGTVPAPPAPRAMPMPGPGQGGGPAPAPRAPSGGGRGSSPRPGGGAHR